MDDLTTLTTFLGWCSVINIGLMLMSSFFLKAFGTQIKGIHGAMFRISEESLDELYFNYLGNYKLATIVLNVVPYFALKIMAG
jgi:hypothetical protein